MPLRNLLCIALATAALTSCSTPYKKKDEIEKKEKQGIKDHSADMSFQSFLGRLRIGAAKRDRVILSSMMVRDDFGYRWDPAPAGETAFDYWDKNNLWPKLEAALQQPFVAHETYMVTQPTSAGGYTAGLRMVNGSWRFAYFVPPDDTGEPAESTPNFVPPPELAQ